MNKLEQVCSDQMVTNPEDRQNDRQIRLKTLPSCNFAGGWEKYSVVVRKETKMEDEPNALYTVRSDQTVIFSPSEE